MIGQIQKDRVVATQTHESAGERGTWQCAEGQGGKPGAGGGRRGPLRASDKLCLKQAGRPAFPFYAGDACVLFLNVSRAQ